MFRADVSIPDRVLGFFWPAPPLALPSFSIVSIPDRVLGFFRPTAQLQAALISAKFQSLIGF